ncbi:MAG: tRNA glutamyl-Q(34) synthetase GluQRS [Gammaproteobacteria bacterium]|nr:tRNA glutamyl-Q(34) synthetase GluQRS [Gammaproteobacteria bacterium]
MMESTPQYRGRFAPSPTGPLHFGSLVAAMGSYLEARSREGQWLVRMEDIDPPREVAGSADSILHSLEHLGMHWDGAVLYQSRRYDAYDQALAELERAGHTYPCSCSRTEILKHAVVTGDGPIYPGTCRLGVNKQRLSYALRVRVSDGPVEFKDHIQGRIRRHLKQDVGDFVLRRADGLPAYQLAVVVDDAMQGISHVVRGCDLFSASLRQIYLQSLLGLAHPHYFHLPIVVNDKGEKLSKQTFAAPLDENRPVLELVRAWGFLGQDLPVLFEAASVSEFWAWAVPRWQLSGVPRQRQIPLSGLAGC